MNASIHDKTHSVQSGYFDLKPLIYLYILQLYLLARGQADFQRRRMAI